MLTQPESCQRKNCAALLIPTQLKPERASFLAQALDSLEPRVHDHIYLVLSLDGVKPSPSLIEKYRLNVIEVESTDLVGKLQSGIDSLPKCVDYLSWIGDDDEIVPDGTAEILSFLRENNEYGAAFGNCLYIDSKGRKIGISSVGQLAQKMLPIGPMLIPQPSTIFRKSVILDCGGLSPEFDRVFDYLLLLKINQRADIKYVDVLASKWRWHRLSGSTSRRIDSSIQAWIARTQVRSRTINFIAFPLDLLVAAATALAGALTNLLVSREND